MSMSCEWFNVENIRKGWIMVWGVSNMSKCPNKVSEKGKGVWCSEAVRNKVRRITWTITETVISNNHYLLVQCLLGARYCVKFFMNLYSLQCLLTQIERLHRVPILLFQAKQTLFTHSCPPVHWMPNMCMWHYVSIWHAEVTTLSLLQIRRAEVFNIWNQGC